MKQGMVLSEAKQALSLLRSWYKQGLIDPDFTIMDKKQVQEKMINSRAGIYEGSAFDGDLKQPISSSLIKAVPCAKLQVFTPPTGSTGQKGWPESPPSYNDIRAISAKAKDPERLWKLIDWSAGPGFELVTFDSSGVTRTFPVRSRVVGYMERSGMGNHYLFGRHRRNQPGHL